VLPKKTKNKNKKNNKTISVNKKNIAKTLVSQDAKNM
jgi:hypothetical protein